MGTRNKGCDILQAVRKGRLPGGSNIVVSREEFEGERRASKWTSWGSGAWGEGVLEWREEQVGINYSIAEAVQNAWVLAWNAERGTLIDFYLYVAT